MHAKTAVLLGATGLIRNTLLQLLSTGNNYSKIRVIIRRPLSFEHPKLDVGLVDFNREDEYKTAIGNGDVIFCCIGTTMKNVKGNKTLYKQIDFDIPVNAAKWGIEKGFSKYLLVSAVGAGANASNFYLQLKGSVEDAIRDLAYQAIHIFRTSLLLGSRKELRGGEKIAQFVMPALSVLLMGSLQKYKPVAAKDVAKAMLVASKTIKGGSNIYVYPQIKELAA